MNTEAVFGGFVFGACACLMWLLRPSFAALDRWFQLHAKDSPLPPRPAEFFNFVPAMYLVPALALLLYGAASAFY